MKQSFTLWALVALLALPASHCRKNKPQNPIDQLPPETQIGKNTFGCIIDGKVFLPKGSPFAGPVIKAQYQYYNGRQGFSISARRSEGESTQGVGVGGSNIGGISIGVYELNTGRVEGRLSGSYNYNTVTTLGNSYYTDAIRTGQIHIKLFDSVNQIVSGTFWFDAIDSTTGKVVQVRDGASTSPS